MRRNHILILVFLLLGVAYWLLRPSAPPAREQAYVFERKATVWNRLATVREPAGSLRYGERVGIIETKQWSGADYFLVLAPGGATGWVDARQLMPAELWQRAHANLEKSKAMPLQAAGKTKVLTNLRVEAGRAAPRSFQLGRDMPVEILARAVVDRPTEESSAAKKSEEQAGEQTAGPRREDWLLVRTHDEDAGDLAGWVLGRFIELNLPAPLRDYAAGQRFIAWFELNRVPASPKELSAEERAGTGEPSKQTPTLAQYLAAAVTGGESQPCDFTRLRFYSWNASRRRYETAYIESNFCGRLPIRVTPIPAGANLEKSEASFSFTALGKSGEEIREYRMKQNVVRRLRARK
jgi:hypothetical protein